MSKKAAQDQEAKQRGGGYSHVPAQEGEEDIVEESGAERDEETGELVIDEEQARKLGAIDPETLRESRRIDSVANKQKMGKKRVSFGTDDPLVKYDGLLKSWGPNSIYMQVKRLTGSQVIHQIRSCPRSGVDLYDALMRLHGESQETEYEIKFKSTDGHQWRGTGRITLPDTRPASQQGQPVNHNPYYPPNNGAPPTAAQGPAPDAITQFGQMFEMFQRFSRQQPLQQPPFVPPQQPSDMSEMARMFEMFQRMQGGQPAAPPPVVVQQPQAPVQPTSSISETMNVLQQAFNMFRQMQPPAAPQGPMFRGRDPNERPHYPGAGQPPPTPPAPQQTFREAIGVVRQAIALREEFDAILPGRHDGGRIAEAPEQDESSPIRVEEIGSITTIRDNDQSGKVRVWESIAANIPSMLKWGTEQADKINKERQRQQQQREPRRQLAPGYIEVTPGYEPPPGFTVVPVEQVPQADLPPVPRDVPPPLESTPPARRTWEAPTIPSSEEE